MLMQRYLATLAGFSAVLAACGGDVGDSGPPANGNGSAGSAGAAPGSGGSTPLAGSSGAAAAGAPGAGGAGPSGGGGGATCTPGIPATSQIPRLSRWQYDAAVRDLLEVTTLASAGDSAPSAGLYADFDGPINVDAWRLYQEVADKIAAEVMAGPKRSKFIECDPAAAGCLNETIRTFGRKAFRRPLTDAEVASFERLSQVTPPGTPEEIAEATLYAFLVSPSFLQIVEQSTAEMEGAATKLSSHEVAARLSFLLWGSVPDDILSAAADRGELATKAQILAQAERMIAIREKSGPLIAAYHRSYLDMENDEAHWWKLSHDTAKFPAYSDAAVPAMKAELDRFFEELAFSNGSFKDLFLSNIAFVNRDTAAIYDLNPADYGTELERVELDATQRPGFLTRAGFLSSFSHYDGTSPILRGAFITVNIIGVNPGAPDPNFFLTPPPTGTFYTERAYVEALTAQPTCSGCHTPFINPPGFVLENYDAIGKWQTIDPRGNGDATLGAIDPTATVSFSADNVKTVGNARQLMEEISKTPLARHIYVEKTVSFATGRLPNPADACTVNLIDQKLSQDGYGILDLLADLTQADSFRLRTRED
jgi:hypothetical protein